MKSKNRKIALACDSLFLSQCRVQQLQALGFDIVFCENAQAVLKAFSRPSEEIPEMLIVDTFLEHGDEVSTVEGRDGTETGIALYGMLRKRFPHLRIVIYTTSRNILKKLKEISDPLLGLVDDTRGSFEEFYPVVTKLLSR